MASKTPKDAGGSFEQDPWVDRLRPDPSAAPVAAVILEGLAGKSTRNGYVRLYFNTALNYYAEFASADMLFCEAIPPEQAPFVGHKATRAGVRQDAVVDYTRTAAAQIGDPFALDIRSSSGQGPLLPTGEPTIGIECFPTQPFGCTGETCRCGTQRACLSFNTCQTDCGATCQTDCHATCDHATCHTCATHCGRATCDTCNQATCHTCATKCGQATCHTCNTCNQATCHTCATQCNQDGCHTAR
jgi:hypothetical protein